MSGGHPTMLLEIRGGRKRCRVNGRIRGNRIVAHVVVRDDDFSRTVLLQLAWQMNNKGYPVTVIHRADGGQENLYLHRLVFAHYYGEIPDGKEIDHKNRDKFNATPENLRAITHAENVANGSHRKNNSSGYRGVSWKKDRGVWEAYIHAGYRKIRLGYFSDLVEAARVVNAAFKQQWPEVEVPNHGV